MQEKAALLLPWIVYMLTFIVTNSFLHIIASAQDIEAHYQSLGDANAVISVLVFRKYFICRVNCGGSELNMSDFAVIETGTHSGAPETFIFLKYHSV